MVPDEPASRSSALESGPRALTSLPVGFRPLEKNDSSIDFWLWCFEKSCRYPLCAPDDVVGVGKYRRKNVDGDEGFLTTI